MRRVYAVFQFGPFELLCGCHVVWCDDRRGATADSSF